MARKLFEYDIGYLQSSVEVLESYLLSDEEFWPLSRNPPEGSPDYPRLTLGSLLLAQTRLNAYSLSPSQVGAREKVLSDIDRLRIKWRVRWESKAKRSFGVRLRMWGDFLEEYRGSPQDNTDRYVYEVRLRAMLELLKSEGGGQQTDLELLANLDKMLRPWLAGSGFIWESEVQTGFPREIYWYLYGLLPGRNMKG